MRASDKEECGGTSARRALIVLHQARSDPGRVGMALRRRGFVLDARRPAIGEPLPAPEDCALAVVFGGPMSANDDHLPFIRDELRWIEGALAKDTPIFGVCLGAQLMARALGAKVVAHPQGQIEAGYYAIEPTHEGRDFFPEGGMRVYQWHREGYVLPEGACRLATGAMFAEQAMTWGSSLGVQFHPEVSLQMMMRWLKYARVRLRIPGARPAWQHVLGRAMADTQLRRWLDHALDRWLAQVGLSALPPPTAASSANPPLAASA